MLPQPINSSECHALHVMYVLFVYAVGFLFWAAEANMLNNFYLSKLCKAEKTLTTMKASKLLTCVCLAVWLDSAAKTLKAPAWTAKKERMPETEPMSRTTYTHEKRIEHLISVSYLLNCFIYKSSESPNFLKFDC